MSRPAICVFVRVHRQLRDQDPFDWRAGGNFVALTRAATCLATVLFLVSLSGVTVCAPSGMSLCVQSKQLLAASVAHLGGATVSAVCNGTVLLCGTLRSAPGWLAPATSQVFSGALGHRRSYYLRAFLALSPLHHYPSLTSQHRAHSPAGVAQVVTALRMRSP